MAYLPIPGLVAAAWLQSLDALEGIDITQKLKARATWQDDIAITVYPLPSSQDVYTPLRSPTIQVNIYAKAASEGSTKVPLNRAYVVAEQIREATLPFQPVELEIGGGTYMSASVKDVVCETSPYEGPPDPSGYGRVILEIKPVYMPVYTEL